MYHQYVHWWRRVRLNGPGARCWWWPCLVIGVSIVVPCVVTPRPGNQSHRKKRLVLSILVIAFKHQLNIKKIQVRITLTVKVKRAYIFIVLSVLEVTQRVHNEYTTSTQRVHNEYNMYKTLLTGQFGMHGTNTGVPDLLGRHQDHAGQFCFHRPFSTGAQMHHGRVPQIVLQRTLLPSRVNQQTDGLAPDTFHQRVPSPDFFWGPRVYLKINKIGGKR